MPITNWAAGVPLSTLIFLNCCSAVLTGCAGAGACARTCANTSSAAVSATQPVNPIIRKEPGVGLIGGYFLSPFLNLKAHASPLAGRGMGKSTKPDVDLRN